MEKEIIKKDESDKIFCTFKLSRTSAGIKLYIKSPLIEKLMSSHGERPANSTNNPWGGINKFYPTNISYLSSDSSLNLIGYDFPIHSGNYNLSFLRAEGISQGLTLHFNTLPISKNTLDNFCNELKAGLKTLYIDYCKAYNYEGTLEIKEGITL